MRGNRGMSRGVNTETGVWQGTVIRFTKQPALFSLLWVCFKTLSSNWRSQRPTAGTPFPCISLLGIPILLHCTPLHLSDLPSTPSFLFPFGAIRFTPRCPTKMDWPLKHPFCLHQHPCIFSCSFRGVSAIPPVSPVHWLPHNVQYLLRLE